MRRKCFSGQRLIHHHSMKSFLSIFSVKRPAVALPSAARQKWPTLGASWRFCATPYTGPNAQNVQLALPWNHGFNRTSPALEELSLERLAPSDPCPSSLDNAHTEHAWGETRGVFLTKSRGHPCGGALRGERGSALLDPPQSPNPKRPPPPQTQSGRGDPRGPPTWPRHLRALPRPHVPTGPRLVPPTRKKTPAPNRPFPHKPRYLVPPTPPPTPTRSDSAPHPKTYQFCPGFHCCGLSAAQAAGLRWLPLTGY